MAKLGSFNTKVSANRGVDVDIPNPIDGIPTGFVITILGKDSDQYRKVESEQRERAIRAANTTGTFRMSPEMIENNATELIVACVKTWKGLVNEDDTEIPFSTDALKDLMKESPYVREVLDRNIGDRSLFAVR